MESLASVSCRQPKLTRTLYHSFGWYINFERGIYHEQERRSFGKICRSGKKLSPEEFEEKYVKDSENIDETERKEKQEDGTSDMF